MHAAEPVRVGVMILAAGRSSRMGQPKLLLPWGDTSVIGHLVAEWRCAGAAQVAPVCSPDHVALHQELECLGIPATQRIVNPDPDRGMFSSIQCAAAWNGWRPELTHWAIALGDQPHLRSATLQAILQHCCAHPGCIVQPSHQGQPAHPVILPRNVFEHLPGTGAGTLREFLERASTAIRLLELPDPGLPLDIDRPEDYERARRL